MAATDRSRPDTSSTVTALMTAALALPGAPAGARQPVSDLQADYRYSAYREDALPDGAVQAGSTSRFEVDTHQLDLRLPLAAPFGTGADLDVSLQHETMSGASPWFVVPDADDRPVQVMSGATIQDERDDILARANFLGERRRVSVSAGFSEEKDYRAVNAGLEVGADFHDGLTTVEAGLGYSDDTIEPVDAERFPSRVREADKDSLTAFAGLSRVLDQQSTIQTSLSFTENEGFLSDPYKQVYVGGEIRADTRPERRRQGTWMLRYRRFVARLKAALHADYRYYLDDWGIHAHTLRLSWFQTLPGGWRVTPSVRYHSQSEADFYAPFFESEPDDRLYTSDYRMSPFGAVSGRLRVDKAFGGLEISVSYEVYDSDPDLALGNVDVANPALVDFDVISASVKHRFDR